MAERVPVRFDGPASRRTAGTRSRLGRGHRWVRLRDHAADNHADRVTDRLVDGGQDAYDRYEVFRRAAGDRMYVVVKYLAPDRDEAILVAGSYRLRFLEPIEEAAAEAGELVTRLKRTDGTAVATFRDEAYERFFPPAE